MKFSICIPNYNYERYLGRTIESVLAQDGEDFEVLVSDNASTDRSADVVRRFGPERVKLRVNACNIGFAGNLDRAARMATGDVLIMLSSDDLMRPGALAAYRRFYEEFDPRAASVVVSAAATEIDAEDRVTGRCGPDPELWTPHDRRGPHPSLPGAETYEVEARTLLRRCLGAMKNPFNFLATAYPRALYERIEGYGAGRLVNPDKWFHWRLLAVAQRAFFLDSELFAYRVHGANQNAQESESGALKFIVDEYVSTVEFPAHGLEEVGLSRADLERAFVERDIGRHGLATLGRGLPGKARRILNFGRAVYPHHVRRSRHARLLAWLVVLGPVGTFIARAAYRRRGRTAP